MNTPKFLRILSSGSLTSHVSIFVSQLRLIVNVFVPAGRKFKNLIFGKFKTGSLWLPKEKGTNVFLVKCQMYFVLMC